MGASKMCEKKLQNHPVLKAHYNSMHCISKNFLECLPADFSKIATPARWIDKNTRKPPITAGSRKIKEIQAAIEHVLNDTVTAQAQCYAAETFAALFKRPSSSKLAGFFNGWNETHKTTSLVSCKVIMRLAADAHCVAAENAELYHRVMAHMHEVAKDDFGLGQAGHDGMFSHMRRTFNIPEFAPHEEVGACSAFSEYLYGVGVAGCKSAIGDAFHKKAMLRAMMVSVSSEVWNGSEYNYLAQFIEDLILLYSPHLRDDKKLLRCAKAYVMGHSGDVEMRHGLHALAATQLYANFLEETFNVDELSSIMLDYNLRVGQAFRGLAELLSS